MTTPYNPAQVETQLRTEYRTDETPVEAVVTAVAEVTEQSPLEMAPLGAAVDNDALNELVDGHDDSAQSPAVTFDYCGQQVTVTTDSVEVAPSNVSE